MTRQRVLVISKRTSYRVYAEEHNERVVSLIAAGDRTVERLLSAHEEHEATLSEVRDLLRQRPGVEVAFSDNARAKLAERFDLVVTVGGDGTLLAASHQLGPDTPVVGINSSPQSSVGFFCAAKHGGPVRETLEKALSGELVRTSLARMRIDRNDICLHRRVLNEALICHACPAATTRYILQVCVGSDVLHEEEQKSSGIWVGPAAGSTAAQRSAGGQILPIEARILQFVVREPYTPLGQVLRFPMGLVDVDGDLVIRSKTRDARIFLDGDHVVFDATIGDVIAMRCSDEPLTVLGLVRSAVRP